MLLSRDHFEHTEKENEEKIVENLAAKKKPVFGLNHKINFFWHPRSSISNRSVAVCTDFSMERLCAVNRKKFLHQHHKRPCLKWLWRKYFGASSALAGSSTGTPGRLSMGASDWGCGENLVFASAVNKKVLLMVI